MTESDRADLLTDDYLIELNRIAVGCLKLQETMDKINAAARATGLELRTIPTHHPILMRNDISRIVEAHYQAEKRIREAAFAAVEKQ